MPDQRSEYNGSERSEPRAKQARPSRKERPPAASASYTRPPRVQQSAAGATNQQDARVRKPACESLARRLVSVARKRVASDFVRHWIHDNDSASQEAKRESKPRRVSVGGAANASGHHPEYPHRGSASAGKILDAVSPTHPVTIQPPPKNAKWPPLRTRPV